MPLVLPVALGLILGFGVRVSGRTADSGTGDWKSRIEQAELRDPKEALQLGEAALVAGGLKSKDQLWLQESMAKNGLEAKVFTQTLEHGDQGLKLAMDLGDEAAQLRFRVLRGKAQMELEQFSRAKAELESGWGLGEKLEASGDRESRLTAARFFKTFGSVYFHLDRLGDALTTFNRSLKIYDQLGDAKGQAMVLDAEASVHADAGQFEEAVACSRKAIAIGESLKNAAMLAQFHGSFAYVLLKRGDVEAHRQELFLARSQAMACGDISTALVAMANLSDSYVNAKAYEEAIRIADEALPLARQIGDTLSESVCWVNKGIALNRLGRSQEGFRLIQQGLEHFRATGSEAYVAEITGVLAEEYAHQGDYRKAYEASRTFNELKEKLRKTQGEKLLAEARASYETDRKQLQIDALEHDRQGQNRKRHFWIALGALSLASTFALVLAYRRLHRAKEALDQLSLHDPLTGLANRRYLTGRIREDLAQVDRMHLSTPFLSLDSAQVRLNLDAVLLMLDMDHFKSVNDQHGHGAGDLVIRQFAEVVQDAVRDTDTVVRWGGEEFFILARHACREEGRLLAERIRKRVAEHVFDLGNGQTLHKTCSIGYVFYPFLRGMRLEVPWERMANVADQCLYAAKHSGRDMWVGVQALDQDGFAWTQRLQGDFQVEAWVQQALVRCEHTHGREIHWR